MSPSTGTGSGRRRMVWAGRIISGLAVLMLLFSGVMKLLAPPAVMTEFERLGYLAGTARGIGMLEVPCTLFYIIPQTSIYGALLLTAYLGGATATNVRIGDPFYGPVIFGALVWVGLTLRETRLRACLLPGNAPRQEEV